MKTVYLEVETVNTQLRCKIIGWTAYSVDFETKEIIQFMNYTRPESPIDALSYGWELMAGPVNEDFSWGWIFRREEDDIA